jgi:type VI secretion system secreted protein Hcp
MSAEEASRIARAVQRMKHSKRAVQIALPTAAALGAGAAIAAGAIPGSDGTITGCYAGPNGAVLAVNGDGFVTEPAGALRVIDPTLTIGGDPAGAAPPDPLASKCEPQQETQITWNQKGPAGPEGKKGLQGEIGPVGPAGGQGATGGQGAPGTPLIGDTTFGLAGTGSTFLKLDGIAGESTDKAHKGEIQIDGFALSAQGTAQASGGGGAGKVAIQSFTITKTLDKSSPALFQAVATGKHFKDAVLSFMRKAGRAEQTYLKFDFQNVLISSVQDGVSDKATPSEQVAFAFQKCDETYYDAKGKAGPTISVNVGNTLKIKS